MIANKRSRRCDGKLSDPGPEVELEMNVKRVKGGGSFSCKSGKESLMTKRRGIGGGEKRLPVRVQVEQVCGYRCICVGRIVVLNIKAEG